MKNTHASDSDIQKFLFDQLECEPQIANHIISCAECKRRVEIYKSLANDIKHQPEPKLNFNLEDVILDQLTLTKEVSSSYNYLSYFIILVLTGFTLITVLLFKETIDLIVKDTFPNQNYFIISIVVFVFFNLALNAFMTHDKNINLLN